MAADLPTIARDNALHCEVRKIGYRQSKDGIVLMLLIHPNEVPTDLAIAALGSRYMLAMVGIDDDETPKEKTPANVPAAPEVHRDRAGRGGGTNSKSWHEMAPAQQAGMMCNEIPFIKFLTEEYSSDVQDASTAAEFVRTFCGVKSRAEIIEGDKSNDHWLYLIADYRAWMRKPEVVDI